MRPVQVFKQLCKVYCPLIPLLSLRLLPHGEQYLGVCLYCNGLIDSCVGLMGIPCAVDRPRAGCCRAETPANRRMSINRICFVRWGYIVLYCTHTACLGPEACCQTYYIWTRFRIISEYCCHDTGISYLNTLPWKYRYSITFLMSEIKRNVYDCLKPFQISSNDIYMITLGVIQ